MKKSVLWITALATIMMCSKQVITPSNLDLSLLPEEVSLQEAITNVEACVTDNEDLPYFSIPGMEYQVNTVDVTTGEVIERSI